MIRAKRSIPSIERLEDRTCPSGMVELVFGPVPLSLDSAESNDSIVLEMGIETEPVDSPYDWVSMVMIPDQMMLMVNEYDQSARMPNIVASSGSMLTMGESATANAGRERTSQAATMDGSSDDMPPAQMVMPAESLVRPGSSSARRSPDPMSTMAETGKSTGKEKSSASQPETKPSGDSDKMNESGTRGLEPESLAPEIYPDLIGPKLENDLPE
jgi:hypothetical protein